LEYIIKIGYSSALSNAYLVNYGYVEWNIIRKIYAYKFGMPS
jgi:hypothetical protein